MIGVQNIILSCLVAFLVCYTGAGVSAAVQQSRIIGGMVTNISRLPYIVQLRTKDDDQFCGATLVSPRYVISAAHCFGSINYNEISVVGGATTRTDPGVRRRVVRISKHPEYKPENLHSDIVVLKLDAEMVGNNIQPIALCSKPLQQGDGLQISGWGLTGTSGDMSPVLRTVRAPVTDKQTCQNSYGRFVEKNMVCAFLQGKDSCSGDSGGPAVYNNQLCGVVAFGWECGSKIHSGAYTDVYAVRSFIDAAMKY